MLLFIETRRIFYFYKDCDITLVAHFLKMKIILEGFVFFLMLLSLISCQNFPSNYQTLWKKYNYNIVAGDCNVTDFKKPFPKCDNLYGSFTIPDFIKASSNAIVNLFTTNNKTAMYNTIDLFCKAANSYKKCMKAANKMCSKDTIWKKLFKIVKRDHPVYRVTLDFCKNGKLSSVYVAQKPKVVTTTCLKNTLTRLTDGMNHYNQMVSKTNEVLVRDPAKANNAKSARKLKVLCSVSANLKRLFAIVGQSCNKEVKILLFKLTQWVFPPEINGKCVIPNDNPKTYSKKYSTNNKNRMSVFIFGGFHKYRYKKTVETCIFNDNESVNILELDKLQITCIAGVLNQNYTYIKSCSVTFFDDKRNKIDSLDYSSAGVMSKTFAIHGGTSFGATVTKGKGKAKPSTMLTVVNTKTVRVIDRNSGVSFTIMLFTSKQTVNIYSIVVRLTANAYNAAIGQFSRPCMNTAVLSPKRGKRAASPTTSAEANYDAASLNDPNASAMSSSATQETNSLTATDSVFSGGNMLRNVSIFITILPIVALILR